MPIYGFGFKISEIERSIIRLNRGLLEWLSNSATLFFCESCTRLTGIVPLGVFFFVHMFTNSKAMNGAKVLTSTCSDIHDMPYLLFVEICGIFLPLLFHSIYGILISAEAKPEQRQLRLRAQLVLHFSARDGHFSFLFLLFHILNFRFGLIPGLNTTPVAGNADQAFDIVAGEFKIPMILIIYILGVLRRRGIWLTDSGCSRSIGEL